MNSATREIVTRLATKFPDRFIKAPPKGKHGEYVPHDIVNQRALAIVGPHSFEIVELIYNADRLVVGVLGRLTVNIDGQEVTVVEVGDEENPQQGNSASNAKKAASDAYKRCWMRLGLGLHLWSGADYELPQMLDYYQPNGKTSQVGMLGDLGQEKLPV